MEKNIKQTVIKEIIDLGLFKVAASLNKKDWILLKNGDRTPLFLDTAKFISYPKLEKKISQLIWQIILEKNIKFDKILGIPYGGLPFAYNLSAYKNLPCLAIRKEGIKKYSTAGEILGIYQPGQTVLLIEDATVTAKTVIHFAKRLRANDLLVNYVITVLDIGGAARQNLQAEKITLQTLFTWAELYKYYKKKNASSMSKELLNFLDNFVLSIK